MLVEFSPPDVGEAEIEAVAEVLRSGWITTGERASRLEERLAKFCCASGAICLSSGTAALEMTLRLLDIGPGDEVITTAYTYSATAAVICHVGARPILADLPPEGYHITAEVIEPLLTPRTKAVITVDYAGMLCDYRAIKEMLWQKYAMFYPRGPLQAAIGRVAVIADAAHSLGAVRGGVMSGSLADFTCFSFHAVKNVTTAEGGAVCWRDFPGARPGEIRQRLGHLSLHGQSKTAREKHEAGQWEYDIVLPGYKCNMTDISAAIGLVQLERYPDMLRRRRQLAALYTAALGELGIMLPSQGAGAEGMSSCHLYPVYLPGCGEEKRGEVLAGLFEAGVCANVHYKPLPMLTAYKRMGFDIRDYPNAYRRYAGEISLPLHSKMGYEQVIHTAEHFAIQVAGRGLVGVSLAHKTGGDDVSEYNF